MTPNEGNPTIVKTHFFLTFSNFLTLKLKQNRVKMGKICLELIGFCHHCLFLEQILTKYRLPRENLTGEQTFDSEILG